VAAVGASWDEAPCLAAEYAEAAETSKRAFSECSVLSAMIAFVTALGLVGNHRLPWMTGALFHVKQNGCLQALPLPCSGELRMSVA